MPWPEAGYNSDCEFFNVPAGDTYELSFELEEGAEIRYSFVLYKDAGEDIDVTFYILAPSGNVVALHERVKDAEGIIVTRELGRYTLVADNSFSVFTSKKITLAYELFPPSLLP